MTYKGTFKNGVVVFGRAPALKNGQAVQVKPTSPRRKARSARAKRGTAAALLKHVGIWAQDRREVHRMLDDLRKSKQAEVALEPQRKFNPVSGAEESHLCALAEPDVNLSIHPAPIIPVALRRDPGGPVGEEVRLGACHASQPIPRLRFVPS